MVLTNRHVLPEGAEMKSALLIAFVLILTGCNDFPPSGPQHSPGLIVVNVHWQGQGVPGIPVVLVQTRDSVCTGANGLAVFTVPGGHYVVRAYGINRGGPVMLSIDYPVDSRPGGVAIVDIPDCLPCL
jgi:hypothetical protein